MPRGAFSAVGVAAALSVALTACSSSGGAPASDPGATAQGGGSLVVGVTSDPDTLFPWKATQFTAVNVLQNLYGTLTEFDKDLNVVPGLAESWETGKDGKKLTLKLRQGVTFADGSAFDSEDVKASLDKIMDEKTAAVARASLSSVKSVKAPDKNTVVLELSGPDAALPANLATVNMAMLSSDDTEEKLTTTPNGTGPFTLGKRVPSQSLTLTRNDKYWGAEKAKAGSVEFRVIPDESSIVSAMQSGNVQLAVFNDPLVAQTAEGGGTISVAKTPQLNYHVLQLNAQRGELKDVNVRLAMQCAIDRKQVLDTAALGEGEVTGPMTAPAFKSDPNKRPCPTRDLAKAADYLAKAGKSGGVTVKTIVSPGRVRHLRQRGPEPQGPARRGQDQPGPGGAGVRRVRGPLGRRRLRRGRGAERRQARPRRLLRPLLHQRRQPQQGRRLQLARAGQAVRGGQGHRRPGRPQGDLRQGGRRAGGQRRLDLAVRRLHLHRDHPERAGLRADGQRLPAVPADDVRRLRHRMKFVRNRALRRVAETIGILFGVAVVVFVMLRALPGDQITAGLGTEAAALTPAQRQALEQYYGLDQPLVTQFFSWLGNMFTGNFGYSARSQQSVLELTMNALPVTFELAVFSIVLALLIGVPLGMLAASRTNSVRDAAGQVVSLAGLSIPAFLLATTLLSVFAASFGFNPNGQGFAPSSRTRCSTCSRCSCRRSCSASASRRRSCAPRVRRCWRCARTTSCAPPAPRACPSGGCRSGTCWATRSCRS
ncbi:hypothetical protein GCM10020001_009420 [Nonomuraea salmonea]